jgi:hypothetical protein
MVTDLRHFLDLSVDTPGPTLRLAEQLINLVRAATAGDAGIAWETALPCRRRPRNRRCPGRMIVTREADASVPIRWRCSACDDKGVISHWADSPYDLRPRQLTRAEQPHEIVITADVAATLRGLQLLDPDCERMVFRTRAQGADTFLTATEDGLEELIGFVAAEANHETNRPRQKRLDDVFDALNDAAQSPGGW